MLISLFTTHCTNARYGGVHGSEGDRELPRQGAILSAGIGLCAPFSLHLHYTKVQTHHWPYTPPFANNTRLFLFGYAIGTMLPSYTLLFLSCWIPNISIFEMIPKSIQSSKTEIVIIYWLLSAQRNIICIINTVQDLAMHRFS